MTAYYNEIDPFAAQWLRNLIDAKQIAPGVVDTRSIEDIRPDELAGFTQCHFFAGIGLWSLSLRRAGWPDNRPVWTGSCPCQPFSAAGQGNGFADERHLWPAWYHLITECRPVRIYGEQVASKDGLGWFDLVSSDLEGAGYACGAVDLCAAGFGAPHIRQRLGFVAGLEHATGNRRIERGTIAGGRGTVSGCSPDGMADTEHHDGGSDFTERGSEGRTTDARGGAVGSLADAGSGRIEAGISESQQREKRITRVDDHSGREFAGRQAAPITNGTTGTPDTPWSSADWLWCRDEKWRPVEPGTFPLVNGYPARVGVLRAYGNAIVPEVFAALIRVTM